MKIGMFYHSLVSDWNHGNAHFLRGIATELLSRGHEVVVFEPQNSWSCRNLIAGYGFEPVRAFQKKYPGLHSKKYSVDTINLEEELNDFELVLVHEWNDPTLVSRIGKHHQQTRAYTLLFHDTHHRIVSEPESITRLDLSGYDGVLAFGKTISDRYLKMGLTNNAWTWHEAADVRIFQPQPPTPNQKDLVWIGNWGDEERTRELEEFLITPIRELNLSAHLYGVRYPLHTQKKLEQNGVFYGGWVANFEAPKVFSKFQVTVHIPRRPYVKLLPGIPTIRVFEALACGIPLVCALWQDTEGLFTPGKDYLLAKDGREMKEKIRLVLSDSSLASELARNGRKTILKQHTCSHRVDELMEIHQQIRPQNSYEVLHYA